MQQASKRITVTKKLLNSKWTAVTPANKEKHFMVIKLIVPDELHQTVEYIELEAIHSKRIVLLPWQQLNNTSIWQKGWL